MNKQINKIAIQFIDGDLCIYENEYSEDAYAVVPIADIFQHIVDGAYRPVIVSDYLKD